METGVQKTRDGIFRKGTVGAVPFAYLEDGDMPTLKALIRRALKKAQRATGKTKKNGDGIGGTGLRMMQERPKSRWLRASRR